MRVELRWLVSKQHSEEVTWIVGVGEQFQFLEQTFIQKFSPDVATRREILDRKAD